MAMDEIMMVMNPAAASESPKRELLNNTTITPPTTLVNTPGKTLGKELMISTIRKPSQNLDKVAMPLKTQLILRENLSPGIY
jgi:hypothetical protein